jgi:hypothetical protein
LGWINCGPAVNTKNWYKEETDLWAEFGGKSTIWQEVFFKAFSKGVYGWEYVIIRQKSCFTQRKHSGMRDDVA